MTESASGTSVRLRSLDGLRGVAALIVVLHHAIFAWPSFARIYEGVYPAAGTPLWWIAFTPLKIATAGTEAVMVFFVLSGLVLTLPVVRGGARQYDWWDYFPRRVLRLLLPVFASVLVAIVLVLAVRENPDPSASSWVIRHAVPDPTVNVLFSPLDLIQGNFQINNPLWSLRWELVFSLALPVFVAVALLLGRRAVTLSIVCVVVIVLGVFSQNDAAVFLPTFVVGALLAVHLPAITRTASRFGERRWSGPVWLGLLIVSVVGMVSFWIAVPYVEMTPLVSGLFRGLTLIGATGLVVCAIFWQPLVALLSSRVIQWLGRISFSLYLVHVPIELTVVQLVGPGRWYLATALTIILAPAVGWLFWRFVEMPAHRLSRRVGASVSSGVAASSATTAQSEP